ncbi:MAG: nucleotidyltransferase domain-containing protein [Candidatus Micrarchaeota archaeon]|nr:nucleotidyltransferase domain-containing protein [Candidatus Micrarchaeota archaeon]
MDYKSMLLNGTAYGVMARAKERLAEEFGKGTSFSDVIIETLGREMRFAGIDEELKSYIGEVAETVAKNTGVLGVLAYGSVVKGTSNAYSDIDMLVVIEDGSSKIDAILAVTEARKRQAAEEAELLKRRLPTSISPLVLHNRELDNFMPIHFDFLDYGIVLYDYRRTLEKFMERVRGMKHKREYTMLGEVIRWA